MPLEDTVVLVIMQQWSKKCKAKFESAKRLPPFFSLELPWLFDLLVTQIILEQL